MKQNKTRSWNACQVDWHQSADWKTGAFLLQFTQDLEMSSTHREPRRQQRGPSAAALRANSKWIHWDANSNTVFFLRAACHFADGLEKKGSASKTVRWGHRNAAGGKWPTCVDGEVQTMLGLRGVSLFFVKRRISFDTSIFQCFTEHIWTRTHNRTSFFF